MTQVWQTRSTSVKTTTFGQLSASRLQSTFSLMLQRILGCILMQSTFDLTFSSLGGMGRHGLEGSPPRLSKCRAASFPPRAPTTEQREANPLTKALSRPQIEIIALAKKHDKNRCMVALLLATIKCTEFSCLPASSQGHRGFNSLRFFDYLQIGTCFRAFVLSVI